MTTLELLDALDASMAAFRARQEAADAARPEAPSGVGPFTAFSIQDTTRVGADSANNGPADTVHWTFSVARADPVTPQKLRVRLDLAGLTKAEFATVFDVPVASVQDWLTGARPIPSWVLPSIRVFELLSPAERSRLLKNPAARTAGGTANLHPFARIEDL